MSVTDSKLTHVILFLFLTFCFLPPECNITYTSKGCKPHNLICIAVIRGQTQLFSLLFVFGTKKIHEHPTKSHFLGGRAGKDQGCNVMQVSALQKPYDVFIGSCFKFVSALPL